MRVGLAGGAALIGVVGWWAARAKVAAIERNPDPFPRDQLAREPQGEEVLIHRPDGTVLRALVAGEGPTVVLAHGYTATLGDWNIVWDELVARGHRVIAFDQRGHGRSTLGSAGIGSEPMAADYAAVLEHFDVRDGVLVGHSMGGFVAIRAVLDHPEPGAAAARSRALRDLGWPHIRRGAAEPIADAAVGNRCHATAGAYQDRWRAVRRLLLRQAPVTGDDLGVPRRCSCTQDHGPLLPILHAFVREDRYPRLAEITVPTVVMVGSADRATPPSHAAAARRRGARRAAGYRARRRAPAELGGARRAGRGHRVVQRVARAGCLSIG